MNPALKAEALEQIELHVRMGFDDEEEIFEGLREMFFEEDDFNEEWLKGELSTYFSKHVNESKEWKHPTDFERLVKVFDQLNEEGIVSLHRAGYTRQDAEDDCFEMIDTLRSAGYLTKGYCYYHSQDLERALNSGILYLGYYSADGQENTAQEVVETILNKLKQEEFQVEWNGSLETRPFIKKIDWKKVPDNIDYNHGRIISIHKNKGSAEPKKNKKQFWKFW